MAKEPTYGKAGSLSHATMHPEHLFPRFIEELHRLDHKQSRLNDIEERLENEARLHAEAEEKEQRHENCYWSSIDCAEDLDDLFSMLETHAPDLLYFGSHPGNSSDYGFWLPEDWEEEFKGLKVGDLAEIPEGYTGQAVLVNDDGNTSLYNVTNGEPKVVWELV